MHPNTQGYLLLADAFYRAIVQSGVLGEAPDNDPMQPEIDLPLTELDIRYAVLKIDNLLRQYPFSQPERAALPFVERDALDKLLRLRLQNGEANQLQIPQAAVIWRGEVSSVYLQATNGGAPMLQPVRVPTLLWLVT